MEQDLFNWLNSQKTHNDSQGTGLLLAPLNAVKHEDNGDNIIPQEIAELSETVKKLEAAVDNNGSAERKDEITDYIPENEESDSEFTHYDSYMAVPEKQEQFTDYSPENEESDSELDYADSEQELSDYTSENDDYQPDFDYGDSVTTETPETAETDLPEENTSYIPEPEHTDPDPEPVQENPSESQESEQYDLLSNHEWQERATGFTLSLDEPPPELWTNLNNNDDEEPEYEETDSLQGAAYRPLNLHGRNFTDRLHHTLKHRKERAVQRAEAERESETSHPLIQKTFIFCMTLLMAIGFAYLALWFIGRETPEGMKKRAEKFTEAGEFDRAEEIYRIGYRRYPNDKFFIEAIADTAQKAGHVQTAKAARDESDKHKSKDIIVQPVIQHVHVIPKDKPLTFEDYVNEGNHAYNIGMYNRAVINFFRAMELNGHDIRPYIGLSNAYRMKGMYFDSKRILDEAREKFRRNPDIEMGYIFLREAK